jgi:hypothetical protein
VAPPPGRRHQSPAATPQNSAVVRRWREEISFWKKEGVTHVTLHNTFAG